MDVFQSTYLYKVRLYFNKNWYIINSFNPRTYIRYDVVWSWFNGFYRCFNPRTYIRYDCMMIFSLQL